MNISWKQAFRNPYFVYALGLSVFSLLALAYFMPYLFREVIAHKPGKELNDYVLDTLPPSDWSWTIFTLIYSCIALTMITNFRNPIVIIQGMAMYSLVTWLRMLTIYLFTLEAPKGIIALTDPFLSHVVYSQEYFVKDLFFSGHISSMTVFVLIEPNRRLWWLKAIATVVVAVLLLVQHVHYTLDIVVAPFFSYAVYRLVLSIQNASDKFRYTPFE